MRVFFRAAVNNDKVIKAGDLNQHKSSCPTRRAEGFEATDAGNQVRQKLQDDLKAAMKAGDKLRLMTLRGIISEITRVEKDVRRPANETEIVQVIKRERARREEALEFARKAARDDLIAQNSTEAKILDEYLPVAAD